MITFSEIYEQAAARKGGAEALEDMLSNSTVLDPAALAAIPDDRWLSQASRMVFSAGFSWKVVEQKWPSHETAFENFVPGTVAHFPEERLHELASDASIIRHGAKIKSVQENANWFLRVADDYGSFGTMVGNWPATDYFSLLEKMKKEGTRLSGTTGQYFLRFMGVPSFIGSASVEAALKHAGVIDKALSTKSAQRAAQEACNRWMEESGRSLTIISRVLALSTDA